MVRVVVWNEFQHEKHDPRVQAMHPNGLHNTVADILRADPEISVTTATLDDPECGLTEEVLQQTDVLFWWGHMAHDRVPDEVVERVKRHVQCGMGLVVLHSGHMSKIFRALMGTSGTLRWHDDARERVYVVNPAHPIAKGLPLQFEIATEECYAEPFGIPEPDQLVFLGWFNTGEVFRAGCCFYRDNGRIFYFQPGHETNDAFRTPEVQQILRNAAHWAVSSNRIAELKCPHIQPLEEV